MARRISLIAVALIGLVAGMASAQERFGGLTGTVTDSTKAAVPGATVTATNLQTGAQRVVVSSADGTYRVPDLDPGRYSITFELDTFQKVRRGRRHRPAGTNRRRGRRAAARRADRDGERHRRRGQAARPHQGHAGAQHHGRRVRPAAQGAQLPGPGPHGPRRQHRRARGRPAGERRQRRRELLHHRRRRDQQPALRQLAPEHGVRIPAGSAGQDRRRRRRIRRRPRRRDQRRHQVGRQHLQRRDALLLHRQRPQRRPGEAARAQPERPHRRRLLPGRPSSRTTRASSAARWADRSSGTSCSSSARCRRASCGAPTNTSSPPAPSRARSTRSRRRGRASASCHLRRQQGARQRQPADDAHALDRAAARLRLDGHQLADHVAGGQPGGNHPRLRERPEQRRAATSTSGCATTAI